MNPYHYTKVDQPTLPAVLVPSNLRNNEVVSTTVHLERSWDGHGVALGWGCPQHYTFVASKSEISTKEVRRTRLWTCLIFFFLHAALTRTFLCEVC